MNFKNLTAQGKVALSTLILSLMATSAFAGDASVITATNDPAGNALEIYQVGHKGTLDLVGSVMTGGLGSGNGLGNQGGLAFDRHSQLLAAVNAGDDTVSVFRNGHDGLELVTRFASGGVRPISVTLRGQLLYVLNAGDAMTPSTVQGFYLYGSTAHPISGGNSGLSMDSPNPAEIKFSPNGRTLVVTEKGTNMIDVFRLDGGARIVDAAAYPSNGATPFGFDFDKKGRLFVSEANGVPGGSSLSSYKLGWGGLQTISGSSPTNQLAACWAFASPNGKFVMTTNAASGSISTFGIGQDGALTLNSTTPETANYTPLDGGFSSNGRYLYIMGNASHEIVTYWVNGGNGALTPVDHDAIPVGANGLVYIDGDDD